MFSMPRSALLTVSPGGTISSMASRMEPESSTSAAGSSSTSWSIVRGPIIAEATDGWTSLTTIVTVADWPPDESDPPDPDPPCWPEPLVACCMASTLPAVAAPSARPLAGW